MKKAVIYKEPKSYFTPAMLKAADAYDKANAAKKETAAKSSKPSSGKK